MARLNIVAIRQALADTVAPVVPQSTPYRPNNVNNLPACWVDMPPVEKLTFQSAALWNLPLSLVLAVSDSWDRSSQQRTDELMVDIWEVLDADKTLGGAVSAAVASEFQPVSSLDARGWVGGVFSLKVSVNATLTS